MSQPQDVPADQVEEIERERQERLAGENRPDHVEVDNTQRDFDTEKGLFTDSPGYDEAPSRFPAPGAEDPTRDASGD